ncbi:MAG: hypothetical protein JXA57_10815 [Armatimonadetes bacterium]|nr:hypothetical protein [Armatimonadota bacterium]
MRIHVVLLCCFAVAASASPGSQVTVIDNGWSVIEREGARTVEMSVIIANHGETPVRYQLLLSAERAEKPSSDGVNSPTSQGADTWVAVKTVCAAEGVLEPGTSVCEQADLVYDELVPGKAHRFRARVIDPGTGAELASAQLTRAAALAAPGVGGVGLAALSQGVLPGSGQGGASGVMVGTHEAHRINGEWTETGQGTITMATAEGQLRLDYTYHAQGPTAAELSATAQAHGELTANDGTPVPAEISSASATMTYPGFRRETDGIISRSGASATGTFAGTVGEVSWSGILTLQEGTYTLDPATGTGEHSFEIQLVHAVASSATGQAARLQQNEGGR